MSEWADVFADLEDPRAVNARLHSLHDILIIALRIVVSGDRPRIAAWRRLRTDMELYDHANLDLLQSFPKLENGIPSHDTFSRVLKMLDPGCFQRWFPGFMGQFAGGIAGVVALDGKTLRRSCDRAVGQSPLHPASAWCWDRRPRLLTNHDKSNEIAAAPRLLAMLSLRGKVVTPIFDQSHRLAARMAGLARFAGGGQGERNPTTTGRRQRTNSLLPAEPG